MREKLYNLKKPKKQFRPALGCYYLRALPRRGVEHTFHRDRSALGAGMVMMLRCHHLNLTMMCCRWVNIPPVEPSLMGERASQNSRTLGVRASWHPGEVCWSVEGSCRGSSLSPLVNSWEYIRRSSLRLSLNIFCRCTFWKSPGAGQYSKVRTLNKIK